MGRQKQWIPFTTSFQRTLTKDNNYFYLHQAYPFENSRLDRGQDGCTILATRGFWDFGLTARGTGIVGAYAVYAAFTMEVISVGEDRSTGGGQVPIPFDKGNPQDYFVWEPLVRIAYNVSGFTQDPPFYSKAKRRVRSADLVRSVIAVRVDSITQGTINVAMAAVGRILIQY